MKHVIRIACPWLRVPLVLVLFPIALLEQMVAHPDKRRLLEPGFYALPINLFIAAVAGEFVP